MLVHPQQNGFHYKYESLEVCDSLYLLFPLCPVQVKRLLRRRSCREVAMRDNVVYWKTKRKIKDDLQWQCRTEPSRPQPSVGRWISDNHQSVVKRGNPYLGHPSLRSLQGWQGSSHQCCVVECSQLSHLTGTLMCITNRVHVYYHQSYARSLWRARQLFVQICGVAGGQTKTLARAQ